MVSGRERSSMRTTVSCDRLREVIGVANRDVNSNPPPSSHR